MIRLIVFALSITLLGGCKKNEQTVEIYSDATVLIFGDSLARGTGGTSQNNLKTNLSSLLGIAVNASGVNGETALEGYERLKEYMVNNAPHPDLVIISLGGNDIIKKRPFDRIYGDLLRTHELLDYMQIQHIFIAVPEPAAVRLEDHPLYDQLHEEAGANVLKNSYSKIIAQARYRSDPAHPNGEGYSIIARDLASMIEVIR